MFFGWGKRKKCAPDPLEAYDALLEDLGQKGAELRKAAATLLTLRNELSSELERDQRALVELRRRAEQAQRAGEPQVEAALERDSRGLESRIALCREAFGRAGEDGELLLEGARELAARTQELELERAQARVRVAAGGMVREALQARSERIGKVLALEAARDEVERAHALAEIYRQEARSTLELPEGRKP